MLWQPGGRRQEDFVGSAELTQFRRVPPSLYAAGAISNNHAGLFSDAADLCRIAMGASVSRPVGRCETGWSSWEDR